MKDAVSGQYVEKGGDEQANVYLSLQHKDEERGRPFVSAVQSATEAGEAGKKEFVINWAINPNAVQGPGSLIVSAKDADGNHLPLYMEGSKKKSVHFDVTIGGNISVESTTYSTSESTYSETAFIVEFKLACQEKSLRYLSLSRSLFLPSSPLFLFSWNLKSSKGMPNSDALLFMMTTPSLPCCQLQPTMLACTLSAGLFPTPMLLRASTHSGSTVKPIVSAPSRLRNCRRRDAELYGPSRFLLLF